MQAQAVNSHNSLPDTGFIRLTDVLRVVPVSRATWYRWIAEGKAPRPIKLGPQISAWRVETIRDLIDTPPSP